MKLKNIIDEAFAMVEEIIIEEWEDGDEVQGYKLIKKSGVGTKRYGSINPEYADTWLISKDGKYYPAKMVRNSMTNKTKVRIYKQDGTTSREEAWKKVLAYRKELGGWI